MALRVWSSNQKHHHHPHVLETQILSPHPISTESEALCHRSPAGGPEASLFESHCAILWCWRSCAPAKPSPILWPLEENLVHLGQQGKSLLGKGLKNSYEFLLQIEYQRLLNTLPRPVYRTPSRVKNSTEPLHLVMLCLKKKTNKEKLKRQFKQHAHENCTMPGPMLPLLSGDLHFHKNCSVNLYRDKVRPQNHTDDNHSGSNNNSYRMLGTVPIFNGFSYLILRIS